MSWTAPYLVVLRMSDPYLVRVSQLVEMVGYQTFAYQDLVIREVVFLIQ